VVARDCLRFHISLSLLRDFGTQRFLSSGRKQLTGFVGRSIRQLIVLAWRSRGARSMRDARARGLSTHDQSDDVHSRQDEDAPAFSIL
jgi:hypothetical protein